MSQNNISVYNSKEQFILMSSLIRANTNDNVCSCWFVCLQPKLAMWSERKPRHIERLCTGDERKQSHLTALRDRPCSFLFYFLSGYSWNQKGVALFPCCRALLWVLSIFSFTSDKFRLCNAAVAQYEGCLELCRPLKRPNPFWGGIKTEVGWGNWKPTLSHTFS